MTFKDLTAAISALFGIEIETVEETCAFAVGGEDGAPPVEVMLQGVPERDLVLFSADLGEVPPDGDARLYRTLLGANHLFVQTAGSTLSLDTVSNHLRLQKYEHPDELANDIEKTMSSFLDTALNWAKVIADYRASDLSRSGANDEDAQGQVPPAFDTLGMMTV